MNNRKYNIWRLFCFTKIHMKKYAMPVFTFYFKQTKIMLLTLYFKRCYNIMNRFGHAFVFCYAFLWQ